MDADRLLTLRAVAQAGSVTRAAAALHKTQPAVTHQIQALERSIGVPVLLRHPRGIELTEAGRSLLTRANEVARALDLADREMAVLRRAETGTVRVVAFPSACATFVATAFEQLGRSHPGVEMTLDVREPPAALAALRRGDADLAVTYDFTEIAPLSIQPNWTNERLFSDDLHVVLSAEHPLARRRRLGLADLPDMEWITASDQGVSQLESLARAAEVDVRIAFTSNDYVAMQAMARAGRAAGLLNALPLAAARVEGIAAPLFRPVSRRSISLVHHADASGLPAVTAMAAALRAAIIPYR